MVAAPPPRGVEGQLAPRHPPTHRPTIRDPQHTDRTRHPYEREREGAPRALALLKKRAASAEAAGYRPSSTRLAVAGHRGRNLHWRMHRGRDSVRSLSGTSQTEVVREDRALGGAKLTITDGYPHVNL